MTRPCHEAEAGRNYVPNEFRSARIAEYYAYYEQRQVLDARDVILLSRELLGDLAADGLGESHFAQRVRRTYEHALDSARRARDEWAALFTGR